MKIISNFLITNLLIRPLKIKNIKKKTALILGAGGVVSSIILALKRNKIKKIIICNRTLKKVYSLKKRFKINFQISIWKNRNNI